LPRKHPQSGEIPLRRPVACRIATVPAGSEHPIVALRKRLTAEFSSDLPAGVHPVARFCGEPQFFPGATGLLTAAACFGSKEELYVAVLEHAYAAIREAEQAIDVDHLDPIAAIRRLAELTFDHHEVNPSFLRLVSIENIHRAEHLRQSSQIANLNLPAIDLITRILKRGYATGTFTRRVDAIDLHMMISAFCVFRVSNQHTFGVIFDRDLTSPDLRDRYRGMLGDMVVSYLVSN
jgi:AcrR family transcriptional regulator